MSETGPLLVHGFAHGEIVARLEGVLGRRAAGLVSVQARNGIVALASPIDRDAADHVFESSESVTALALDHADVLSAIASVHDVVPLRLGTLVSGKQALADLCETQAASMSRVLDAIGNRVEFGVRVVQKPAAVDNPETRSKQQPSDGRSYLRSRAIALGMKLRTTESQTAFCSSLMDQVQSLATVMTLGAARVANGRLMDLACLVERERVEDFGALISAEMSVAEELSLGLEVTGPWPPYSFVTEPPAGTH